MVAMVLLVWLTTHLLASMFEKYKIEVKSTNDIFNADFIGKMCARETRSGINDLMNIIPNLRQYITPNLNIAHELQKCVGNISLSKVLLSDCGLCQSSISVNAQTSEFHKENNRTYTLVNVPT